MRAQSTAVVSLVSLLLFLKPLGSFASTFQIRAIPSTPQIEIFLSELTATLPPRMKAVIGEPVTIQFERLDQNDSISVQCPKNVHEAQEASRQILAKLKSPLLGAGASKPYTIKLHSNFLSIIEAGENSAQKYPCGHGNTYRLAIASAAHELAHIFDFSDKLLTKNDKETFYWCERARDDGGAASDPRCNELQAMIGKISDRINYKNFTGFMGWGARNKNRNFLQSVDPYEFTSANEHFAVNTEYFLLDRNFACRKPALHKFLSQVFEFEPFPNSDCHATQFVIGSNTGLPVNMDPSRAYAVHYLFATKGKPMMSRWGHSMLRVIMCAPERAEPGPECLRDIAYHVVISYRANVEGPAINNWDGLIGKYPSQLMIVSMSEVVEEYTRKELRNLISLPIELSRSEMELLISRAAEQFWAYTGKYYFLSNNCASETDQLIKGVLPEYHRFETMNAISPIGVYDNLEDAKLIDTSLIENRDVAIAKGHYFPSQRDSLENAYQLARSGGQDLYENLEDYLNSSTAAGRRFDFDRVSTHPKASAAFYLLEKAVQRRSEATIQARAIKMILEFEKDGKIAGANQEILELLGRITEIRNTLQPWNLVHKEFSYGIPLPPELISDAQYSERLKTFADSLANLRDRIDKIFPEESVESKRSQENLGYFLNRMRD